VRILCGGYGVQICGFMALGFVLSFFVLYHITCNLQKQIRGAGNNSPLQNMFWPACSTLFHSSMISTAEVRIRINTFI
jgi:hypothetical protein